jgi:hypothetical protein
MVISCRVVLTLPVASSTLTKIDESDERSALRQKKIKGRIAGIYFSAQLG